MPASLVLAIAGLTQFIYPYLYLALLTLDPFMLVVISGAQPAVLRAAGLGGHAIVTAPTAESVDEDPNAPVAAADPAGSLD